MQEEASAHAAEWYVPDNGFEKHRVEQMKTQLQSIQSFASDEGIEQFLHALPEKYQQLAIQAIAEQFVTIAHFHLLNLVALFYQHAEEEGIAREERDEVVQEVEPNIRSSIEIIHRLVIDTPKKLYRLRKVVMSIEGLSQCKDADQAYGWLYNFPVVYREALKREHFIEEDVLYTKAHFTSLRASEHPSHYNSDQPTE